MLWAVMCMQKRWKTYAFYLLLCEGSGGLSAWLSRAGRELYARTAIKPALTPPDWLFAAVWTVIYALLGIGAARIALLPEGRKRTTNLRLFAVQLGMNFFWSLLFFNGQLYGAAFLWLVGMWALLVWMTMSWCEQDRLAAALQLPYLAWVFFAGYLNLGVWLLNR